MHIAIGYNDRNKTRKNFYDQAKLKGYALLTYVSSKFIIMEEKLETTVLFFSIHTNLINNEQF